MDFELQVEQVRPHDRAYLQNPPMCFLDDLLLPFGRGEFGLSCSMIFKQGVNPEQQFGPLKRFEQIVRRPGFEERIIFHRLQHRRKNQIGTSAECSLRRRATKIKARYIRHHEVNNCQIKTFAMFQKFKASAPEPAQVTGQVAKEICCDTQGQMIVIDNEDFHSEAVAFVAVPDNVAAQWRDSSESSCTLTSRIAGTSFTPTAASRKKEIGTDTFRQILR
ncbi:MAG: hypothetical protein U1F16_08250 [Turneriella sp.]